MSLRQVLLERRTIHDYRPGDLPDGALQRAIEAATMAPNHRMTEPWRFVHVGPETRQRLLDVAAQLKGQASGSAFGPPQLERLRAKMLGPSGLLAICQARSDDPKMEREDYAAVSCAVQNAMLSFWNEGVGSKWSTGDVTTDPQTYALLGIDEAQEQIVGFLWLGYPAAVEAPKARRRRSLDEVLRYVP